MNKKAITFGTGLLILTIISIGVSIYYFSHTREKTLQNIIVADAIMEFEQELSRIELYAKEATKQAASQALARMAEQSFIKNNLECLVYEDRLILSEKCKPENLEPWFAEKFKLIFSELLNNYPATLEHASESKENIIKTKIKFNKQENNSINYIFENVLETDFNITEIHLEELENLHATLERVKQQCNEEITCMNNNLKLKNWNTNIKKEMTYFLLDLETKTNHFIKNGALVFDKIRIKFAL